MWSTFRTRDVDSVPPSTSPTSAAQELGRLAQRTMDLHVNVQDGELYVTAPGGEVTVSPQIWR